MRVSSNSTTSLNNETMSHSRILTSAAKVWTVDAIIMAPNTSGALYGFGTAIVAGAGYLMVSGHVQHITRMCICL